MNATAKHIQGLSQVSNHLYHNHQRWAQCPVSHSNHSQQLTWQTKQRLEASTEIIIVAAGWVKDSIRQVTSHWPFLLWICKTNGTF